MDTTEPKGKYTLVKNGNSELRMCPWSGFVRITVEGNIATSFYTHDYRRQAKMAAVAQGLRRN